MRPVLRVASSSTAWRWSDFRLSTPSPRTAGLDDAIRRILSAERPEILPAGVGAGRPASRIAVLRELGWQPQAQLGDGRMDYAIGRSRPPMFAAIPKSCGLEAAIRRAASGIAVLRELGWRPQAQLGDGSMDYAIGRGRPLVSAAITKSCGLEAATHMSVCLDRHSWCARWAARITTGPRGRVR